MSFDLDNPYNDHLLAPRGEGRLPVDGYVGLAGGSVCGDIVEIGITIVDGIVDCAGFTADACPAARAAASATIELISGRSLLDAALVGASLIDSELGGLSPSHSHGARLAADALHRALSAAAVDPEIQLHALPGRALVAMSGGVDSAVAALLMREAGRESVGVTLQLWDDPATDGTQSCCSPQSVTAARELAHSLGIPHLTLDLRPEFQAGVVDPYIAAFDKGQTPNPCVGCNGHVRFDALDALRSRLGARTLVTGHYARIEHDEHGPLLAAADDDNKDQTYMLAALPTELLKDLEFPLGTIAKPRVREIARAAGLAVADKAESQDLCFLAGIGRDNFLERHGGRRDHEGAIVNRAGKLLGRHRGAHRYTVGQRRGLGVAAPEPLYVIDVDPARNEVVVGGHDELAIRRVEIRGVRLFRHSSVVDGVKLRYRSEPSACSLLGDTDAGTHRSMTIELSDPAFGAAPGQVACLLSGNRVVGWATIVRQKIDQLQFAVPLAGDEAAIVSVAGTVVA